MNKTKIVLFIFLLVFTFIALASSQIHGVKSLFNKDEKSKEFTIESNIELAPDGDDNKNNEIDAGDIIRFTYTIINTTDQAYSFATLKTNIDRKQINFIHNLSGTTGVSDLDDTITIPNIRINAQEQRVISFDARINYFQEDKIVSTESEFVSFDKNSIAKSLRKEVKAKKLTSEEVKKRVEKGGLIRNNKQ